MNRARRKTAVAGAALLVAALGVAGARAETPIPDAPTTFVTDQVGMLSPAAAARLEAQLGAVDRQTGHQVLVYIGRTTGGAPIEDWAARAFQRWRVGRKGIDDGVALFFFDADRRVRIEVGYGLEGELPDARAKRIIDEIVVPRMRAGDRDAAVEGGVGAVLAAIGAGGVNPAVGAPVAQVPAWALVVGGLGLLLVLLFVARHPALATWLFVMGSGRWGGGGRRDGGGFGGFSGGGGRSGGGGASGGW